MLETMTWLHRTLASAALALALGSGAAGAASDATSADAAAMDFDAAMLAYEVNHWQQAFAAFAVLADQGHAESARLALQMRRYGPSLYGTRFEASERQLDHWSRLCICADATATPCRLAPPRMADGL